jgi:hypothetical protein
MLALTGSPQTRPHHDTGYSKGNTEKEVDSVTSAKVKDIYTCLVSMKQLSPTEAQSKVLASYRKTLKKVKSDHAVNLRTLTKIHHSALKTLYKIHGFSLDQIMSLTLSTLSDKELTELKTTSEWPKLKPYFKAPPTNFVVFTLVEFLETAQTRFGVGNNLFKLTSFCLDLLHLVTLSYQNSKQSQMFMEECKKLINEKLDNLSLYDQFLVPGGWPSVTTDEADVRGHFMLHLIQKTQEGYVKLKFDTQDDCVKKEKFKAHEAHRIVSTIISSLFVPQIKEALASKSPRSIRTHLNTIGQTKKTENIPFMEMTPQSESFNCCFLSFYRLYQYLILQQSPKENVEKEAERFRSEFYQFLSNV